MRSAPSKTAARIVSVALAARFFRRKVGQGGAQDCAPDPINRIAETIQLTEAHGCREAPCELWQFAAHLRDALM